MKRDQTRAAEVTICLISERLLDRPRQLPHAICSTVHVIQCCSRENEDGLWRGRWVAAQKTSQQHLAGETQPAVWDDPESNRGCPDSHVESGLRNVITCPDNTAGFVTTARNERRTSCARRHHDFYCVAFKLLIWCNRWVRFRAC